MKRRGSMMLEAVLALPIFLFLVFFLVQSAFIWTAHQMTRYAAYCAARAMLVYHPDDYADEGGVAKRAACMVLGWISFSHKGSNPVRIPTATGTDYTVPLSDSIAQQVAVTLSETNDFPAVTAEVDFRYPLVVPIGGLFLLDGIYPRQDGGTVLDVKAEGGGWHYVHIRESYTLPKPYRTETFPVIPDEDKEALEVK